jgi:hypothetical protein
MLIFTNMVYKKLLLNSGVLTISFIFLLISTFGQSCIHDDLSRTLRIKTWVQRKPGDSIIAYNCPVKVTIFDKASKKSLQEISFTAASLYDRSFSKCNWVRSYSTGKNRNAEIWDTDFGDIVVADFNFDTREDIAIKSYDEMSGTYYRFYLQEKDGLFKPDSFLTDSMSLVPTYFNKTKRTLTTYQRAGARDAEMIYRLDVRTNKWRMIRHRFIPPL